MKKLIAVLLIIAMSASMLVGCSGGSDGGNGGKQERETAMLR